jgi:hypothetical protein
MDRIKVANGKDVGLRFRWKCVVYWFLSRLCQVQVYAQRVS